MAEPLVEDIFAALDEQTVTVSGTKAAALIVPSLAASLTAVLDQRKLLAGRIEVPGRRQDRSTHPYRGRRREHLPDRQPSRRLRRTRPGDPKFRVLNPGRPTVQEGKQAAQTSLLLSAFAALSNPVSRAYYEKKTAQGKHHTQALLCLPRRRADVLFTPLRDGTFHKPQPATADGV